MTEEISAPSFNRTNTTELDEDDHHHTQNDYTAAWNEYLLAYEHDTRRASVDPTSERQDSARSKVTTRSRDLSYSRRTDSELSVSTETGKRISREFSAQSDQGRKSERIDGYTASFLLNRFNLPEAKEVEYKKSQEEHLAEPPVQESALIAQFKRDAAEFVEEVQRDSHLEIPTPMSGDSSSEDEDDSIERLLHGDLLQPETGRGGQSFGDPDEELFPSLPFGVGDLDVDDLDVDDDEKLILTITNDGLKEAQAPAQDSVSNAIMRKRKRQSHHAAAPSIVLSSKIWSEMQKFENEIAIRQSLAEETALHAQLHIMARSHMDEKTKEMFPLSSGMTGDAIEKAVGLIGEVHANFDSYSTPGGPDDDDQFDSHKRIRHAKQETLQHPSKSGLNHRREMTVDDIEQLIEMAAANKKYAQVQAVERMVHDRVDDGKDMDDGWSADGESDGDFPRELGGGVRGKELTLEQTELHEVESQAAYVDDGYDDVEDDGKSGTFIVKGDELAEAMAQMGEEGTGTVIIRPDVFQQAMHKYRQSNDDDDDSEIDRHRLGYLADDMVNKSTSLRELEEIERQRQQPIPPPPLDHLPSGPRDAVFAVQPYRDARTASQLENLAHAPASIQRMMTDSQRNLVPRQSMEAKTADTDDENRRPSFLGRVGNLFRKRSNKDVVTHQTEPPPSAVDPHMMLARHSTRQLMEGSSMSPTQMMPMGMPIVEGGRERAKGIDPTNPVTAVYRNLAHTSETEVLHHQHEDTLTGQDFGARIVKPVYDEVRDLLQANPESVQRANFDKSRFGPPPKRKDTSGKRRNVEVDRAGLSNLRRKFTRLDDNVLSQPEYIPTPTEKRRRGCGRLIVKVVGGLCLQGSDWGATNPYCIVKVRKAEAQTRFIRNDLNPVWKELLVFNNYKPKPGLEAVLVCMTKNRLRKDSVVGMAPFVLPDSFASLQKVPLEIKSKRGSPRGVIVLYTFVQRYVFNFPT